MEKSMNKVTILTDSTAYLPEETISDLAVEVLPLTLTWDGVSYRDGIDIKPDEFYARMRTSSTLPVTSQVNTATYSDYFEKLLAKGDSVLVLPISSGISGSVLSAFAAKENFPGAPIEVVDTKLVSMALGFQVLAAARLAKEGASLEECKEVAIKAYDHIGVYFVVDTLKYLYAGGRIGGAQRLMGTALNIKPVLMIKDGKIDAVRSVVSTRKAISAMFELVEQGIDGRDPVHISVFHAGVPEVAKEILKRTEEHFHPVENILSHVSPVIGSHVGPGTVSIAYMAGM
jgi:DegV family protein with EDD domain